MSTRIRSNSTNAGRVSVSSAGTPATSPIVATKLQVLLTGETAAPSTTTGKSGTPLSLTAGVATTIQILAVNATFVVDPSNTHTVSIVCSDAYATLQAVQVLVSGVVSVVVTPQTAGMLFFTVTDSTNGAITAGTSATATVGTGAFSRLLLLMAGENLNPGTASGKSSLPNQTVVGTAIAMTVYATDAYCNPVSSTHTVSFTSNDGAATLPSPTALVGGVKTLSATFSAVGSFTVTATDDTDATKTASLGSAVTVNVNPGTVNVALASNGGVASASSVFSANYAAATANNGDTAGTGYGGGGGLGSAWTSNAGTVPQWLEIDFNASYQINEVDVFSIQDSINSPSTPTLAMTGTRFPMDTFKVQYDVASVWTDIPTASVAGNRHIWVQLQFTPVTTSKIRVYITVAAPENGYSALTEVQAWTGTSNPFTALRLTVPSGAKTSGTAFNVTVDAVDVAGNVITAVTDTVSISSTDGNATLPSNAALVSGTGTFSVTLKTAGTATITASDVTRPSKTASSSGSITVNAAAFSKLQLLLPGETSNPGSSTGKTGAPIAQPSGTPFTLIINACDLNWNVVSSTHIIGITSSDGSAIKPQNAALVAGTRTFTNGFTFGAANGTNQTITASDITDGAKTPQIVNITCGAVAQLTASDFTYQGMFLVPPGTSFVRGFGDGGMTGRIVNGQTRLFLSGQYTIGSPIYEVTPPASFAVTYALALSGAKYATVVNEWGVVPYGNVPTNQTGALRIRGLLYFNNKLFFSWGDAYGGYATDPNIGYAVLGADGSQSATPYGPWNTSRGAIYTGGYMCALPPAIAALLGRPIGYGSSFSGSGNSGSVAGVIVEAGTEPTSSTPTDPVGQSTTLAHIVTTPLADYPCTAPMPIPSSITRAVCTITAGQPCSAGFGGPFPADGFLGPGRLDLGNPDTQRASSMKDYILSTVFIATTKVQGMVAFGQLVDVVAGNDYGSDNKPHVWYSLQSACCHGQPDGINPESITGPRTSTAVRYFFIFSQNAFLNVANGTTPYPQLMWESCNRIDAIAPTTAVRLIENQAGGGFKGCWFDGTDTLYAADNLQDSDGSGYHHYDPCPIIHVWKIRNS